MNVYAGAQLVLTFTVICNAKVMQHSKDVDKEGEHCRLKNIDQFDLIDFFCLFLFIQDVLVFY